VLAALTWIGVIGVNAVGAAQPPAAAERTSEHEARGKAAYAEGDYGTCVKEFQKALIELESERYVYNIAKCSEKGGDLPTAIAHYRRYLAMAPAATDREDVELVLRVLEEKDREDRGVRVVRVTCEPPARVRWGAGDVDLGVTPLEAELPLGDVLLRFDAPGHVPTLVDAFIEDIPLPISAKLEPLATLRLAPGAEAAAVVVDGAPAQVEDGAVAVLPGVREVTVELPGEPRWSQTLSLGPGEEAGVGPILGAPGAEDVGGAALSTWGYATGGVGLAVLGAAIGLGVVAQDRADDANALPLADHTRADHRKLASESEDFALLANIGFGVGGAALAAGIALLVVDAVQGDEGAVTVAPLLSPSSAGACATVSF
jgi:tetratricopeptide (TPR) repeat protein